MLVKIFSGAFACVGSILVSNALIARLQSDPTFPVPAMIIVLSVQFLLLGAAVLYAYQLLKEVMTED